jgi:hypothetical protein
MKDIKLGLQHVVNLHGDLVLHASLSLCQQTSLYATLSLLLEELTFVKLCLQSNQQKICKSQEDGRGHRR